MGGRAVSARRALLVGALLLLAGCTGAADSSDVAADAPVAWAAGDTTAPAGGPCALLSEVEVEQALSATITSSQAQSSDALTRAFTFTLPDDVCEYYGPRALPSDAAGGGEPFEGSPGDVDLPSETVDETLDEMNAAIEAARVEAEQIASRLAALELSVSVSDRPVSREEFKVRYERRVEAFARDDPAASEPGALGVDLRFVEEATDGAKDIGGVGDAARWYPAMAQLDVLVGDTAFAVSILHEAPMVAGIVSGTPVDPRDDPPQRLVDIARLAAERL
jgi:hypothetical protein